MRLLQSSTIILILGLIIPLNLYADVSAPISCWDLQETSGIRTDSITANGNDLSDNNTVLYGTGHINANAGDFEYSNTEYLSITDANQTGLDITGDISMSLWLNFESLPTTGLWSYWINKLGNTPGTDQSYTFYMKNVSGTQRVNMQYKDASSNSTNSYWDWSGVTTGTWYHVVTAWDVDTQTLDLYIDGDKKSVLAGGATASSILNGSSDFRLGSITASSQSSYTMDGLIETAVIYDTYLVQADVDELYNSGTGIDCDDILALGGGGGDPVSTSTATTTTTDDIVFMQSIQIFFLAFIWLGVIFSIFKKV